MNRFWCPGSPAVWKGRGVRPWCDSKYIVAVDGDGFKIKSIWLYSLTSSISLDMALLPVTPVYLDPLLIEYGVHFL